MPKHGRTIIIAEAGVNHNGDLATALEMVDCAASAGADYVKFQTFQAKNLASASAEKARYQKSTTDSCETQLDMLKRLELTPDMHRRLLKRCAEAGIAFLSTAGETESLAFLAKELQLDTIKLGSGELTNALLLLAAARTGARLILSTGMGTLAEVEEALGVLAFGMLQKRAPVRRQEFAEALLDPAGWDALRHKVILLHCTTEYPAAVEETNLRAIDTMRQAFGLSVGYSDHTARNTMSIAAVARGASMIEKHFTLDRSRPGPDHAASLEPDELAELVREIRAVEAGLGNGIKQPGPAEIRNRPIVRRSLVATRSLVAGTVLTAEDMTPKRPGTGLQTMDLWNHIGRRLTRDVAEDAPLVEEDFQ